MKYAARLATLLLAIAAPAFGGDYDAIYRANAEAQGLDWKLVKAIAIVESNENPRAENRRDPSIGLMQIHCVENAQGRCTNRFNVEGWAGMTRERLLDPKTNVHIGTQVLAWNIRTFGFERGIALYNSWAARTTPAGQKTPNHPYLVKVLRVYQQLRVTPAGGGEITPAAQAVRAAGPISSTVTVPLGPRKGL